MDLLIAVLLFTTIFSVDVQAKLKDGQIERDCLKEVGIESRVYDEAMETNVKDADMKIKCMTKCLLKSYQLMKPDGTIDLEKTAEVLFYKGSINEYNREVFEECTATKENECETAHHMVTCANQKIKGIGKGK